MIQITLNAMYPLRPAEAVTFACKRHDSMPALLSRQKYSMLLRCTRELRSVVYLLG